MSGWGCRYQYQDQCLRLRKGCKPGVPGCVLYGKVTFIDDIAPERPNKHVKKPLATKRARVAGKGR